MAKKRPRLMHGNPALLLSVMAITSFFLGFIIGCFCHPQEQTRLNEILLKNTQNYSPFNQQDPLKETPDIFFSVTGRTLGNLLPNSTVFLYTVPSTNFTVVMATIENETPVRETTVNTSKAFQMECISPGDYVFVIPSSSYDCSAGFPLPYEWTRDNYTLDIAFQGGDYRYCVGAFSIRANQEEPSD